ncbi:MAG: (Fe-S)-binding protein [Thermoplasmata archaeon]
MTLIEDLQLELERCINCGFCESVCPTLPSMNYRAIFGARGRVFISREAIKEINNSGKISLNINDSIYSCLECYSCFYVCPAGVNAGNISRMMRTALKDLGSQEKNVAKMIVSTIMNDKNPLGIGNKITSWAMDMEFDEKSDTLLYTSGMYQLMAYSTFLSKVEGKLDKKTVERIASLLIKNDQTLKFLSIPNKKIKKRMDEILVKIVLLLKKSGIKFRYLGKKEPYSGAFLYELGYTNEFIEYGRYIKDLLEKEGIRKIITIDPHTHEVMKILYPKYIENFNFEVYHYLELLHLDLKNNGEKIVYHQPCHFTMHEDFDIPLKFISKMGNVILPDRNGKNNFCCGGPAELLYPNMANSVSLKRFQQLKEKNGDRIVTACPICFVNLAKDSSVYDIAELLYENFK